MRNGMAAIPKNCTVLLLPKRVRLWYMFQKFVTNWIGNCGQKFSAGNEHSVSFEIRGFLYKFGPQWGDIFSDHFLWSIFQSSLHTYYTLQIMLDLLYPHYIWERWILMRALVLIFKVLSFIYLKLIESSVRPSPWSIIPKLELLRKSFWRQAGFELTEVESCNL